MSDHTENQRPAPADAGGELAGTRILVVMPTIPLYGMERKTLSIMQGLRERGADVLFITQREYGQNVQREVERVGCRWVAASFDKLLGLPKGPRHAVSMLRAWLRSALEFHRVRREYKPTHIHLTNITFFLYTWPLLLRAPEVVVFALPTPPDMNLSGYKRSINNFIWRYGVERVCDHIICNSKFTLSQVERVLSSGAKASVIYPQPSRSDRNLEKSPAPKMKIIYNSVPDRGGEKRINPTLDASKLNVAYVGRICPDKGVREFVDVALRVVAERDDVDFHLVGDYTWRNPFAEELIREVSLKACAQRVRFHGEMGNVPGFLAGCDLHVCPSICDEAFGIVVIEAKSASLPSVVFPSGGLKETVNHLVDGYVCGEKTSTALYEGVAYFLNQPRVMKEAGRAAKLSIERFSPETIGPVWSSLYGERKTHLRR